MGWVFGLSFDRCVVEAHLLRLAYVVYFLLDIVYNIIILRFDWCDLVSFLISSKIEGIVFVVNGSYVGLG